MFIYQIGTWILSKSQKWKKPEKVWVTALGLVRRFYLRKHPLQMNPLNGVKAALILAAKIEDVNISVLKTLKVLF